MASERQTSGFICAVCGKIMEHWNSAWVPAYRLVAGPVVMPVKAAPAASAED